ncbi:glycosyltransferase family 2 protein [Pedobacter sp. SL55]|uniref:glycosyltransferase family 2 protein n=1 Tax=Pedobacter sp. SL55 TaxID=2995161 RepID=UPI00227163F3|nr:glycosyltransferase [Pedobacter sp. SL55]WAC41236.1 glycosyltransferase [Pedobacter sp. SL55]
MEIDATPLVSVIVPVYNGDQYVKSCLEMLLDQSYKKLEIIVVDDGSKDQSGIIAKKYPVKVICLEQNRGLSAARNLGVKTATGKYIHFMDVDDMINNDYYQEMVQAMVLTNADLACGGMVNQKFRHKTIRFKQCKVYSDTEEKLRVTYVGRWGYVWRYLFRAGFLQKHNLHFEEGRFIEDLVFSLPAVYFAEKMVVVPKADYTYYERENSIMTKANKAHREKVHQDWLHAKASMLDFARKHNFTIPGVNSGMLAYKWWKVKNLWNNR